MNKNIQIGILYKTENGVNVKWLVEETKETVAHPQQRKHRRVAT